MWDLAEDPVSIALLESFYNSGKPIALVCHSPGVLRHVTYKGEPLVKGKRVTGFTNGEEEEVKLTKIVPFLVEDELLGSLLSSRKWRTGNKSCSFIVDGRLVTGTEPRIIDLCGSKRFSNCSRRKRLVSTSRDNRSASFGDGVLFFEA